MNARISTLSLPASPIAMIASRESGDGKADAIIYRIVGYGTCVVEQLNAGEATKSLLPAARADHYGRVQRFRRLTGIGLVVVGSVGLFGVKKGADAWHERSVRIEAEARAEVSRKDEAERLAARSAEARSMADAMASASQTYATFVGGSAQAPDVFATSAMVRTNPDAVAGIKEAIRLVASGGTLPTYVRPIAAAGAWPAPIVYRQLPAGDVLFGIAIDDGGTRKALVLFKPQRADAYVVRSADPAVEAKAFNDVQGFGTARFDQIRDRLAKGFMPDAAAK